MGTLKFFVAVVFLPLLATPSIAKDGNPTVKHGRQSVAVSRLAPKRSLAGVKQSIHIAVIPTDVRQKRYLTYGIENEAKGGVLPRHSVGESTFSGTL